MENAGITNTVLTFIDEWWGILLPVILMMLFKQYISTMIGYIRLKWSDAPYSGLGNVVKFKETGPEWKIFIISTQVVCLEELDPEDPKREKTTGWAIKIPTKEFLNMKLIYRKV